MKKFIFTFALLICVFTLNYAATGEDLSKYHLKEYGTVEEFREAYLNKVITYSPNEDKLGFLRRYSSSRSTKLREFIVTDIKGKTKKGKDTQDMVWTIQEVNNNTTKTFKVHTGNYEKQISYSKRGSEIRFENFPFFIYDNWKEDHKNEIGRVFENPKVKAKYEVVDVFLSLTSETSYGNEKVFKMYTVKNTISEKESTYIADNTQSLCFKEDLSGNYVSTLAKVEKPSNPTVKFGKTTTIEDEGITKYSYEDNFISIIIFGTATKFSFILKNVSESTQKLIWDEAVFVSYTGSTSKVMHSGIKYAQREASQPASIIIKGASLDDIACPTSNVYYSDILNEWSLKSMYPSEVSMETKQVQLMLPIQIKDVTNEYIFVFDINYKYKYPERLNLPE